VRGRWQPAVAGRRRVVPGRHRRDIKQLLGLDALGLLKDRSYLVFFIASILICIPLAFYYQNANPFLAEIGVTNPTAKMAIGQVSEVLFMLLLPLFIQRFGIKVALLVGMLAWALRYALFAYGNNGELAFMLFTGIALHGICYDFYLDVSVAPRRCYRWQASSHL
jgi:Na+/melibiose symporter-like transporter